MPLLDLNAPNPGNNMGTGLPQVQPVNPVVNPGVQGTAIGPMPALQRTVPGAAAQPTVQPVNQPQGTFAKYDLNRILDEAMKSDASDVHLTVGYRAMIRIDGNLKDLNTQMLKPEDLNESIKIILKTRSDIDPSKLTEADLSYAYNNRRFRVNIFKQLGQLSVVMRLVPKDILTIDQLGIPAIFKEFAKIPAGLILVTGPTGSGKSTTLAAVLNHINNTRTEHIVTLEDPIEFVYPKLNSIIEQREYGIDFNSWPDALKALLRQDPNVVLVGEMRDYDTIASTITVSETGHLVFATLHTNSASQSIDRIIDVFPEVQQSQIRAQLANVLTAVVSQRLVRLRSGGRKSVMELMIANSAVKNAIRENQTYQIDNMIQTGQDYGMISMEKSLVELIRKGEISREEAMDTTVKPKELEILLGK